MRARQRERKRKKEREKETRNTKGGEKCVRFFDPVFGAKEVYANHDERTDGWHDAGADRIAI